MYYNLISHLMLSSNFTATRHICCRCGKAFVVLESGEYPNKEECVYHHGRLLRNRSKISNLCYFFTIIYLKDVLNLFFLEMYNKTIIEFGFCDMWNYIKVSVSGISLANTYLDLDNSAYHYPIIV